MGLISYAWFPFFAAASGIGLGVARWFFPELLDGPPLFPLCHYIVDILYLVTILSRYIYVDKVQSTFWNGFSLIIGIIATVSYVGSIQLVSSRNLVYGYGVEADLIKHIEEGLHCVTPFTTNLYCILQSVVSYKTHGSTRYTGPLMRFYRVLISTLITPVAHYLIFTHITTYLLALEEFAFLIEYYKYVYWAYGGLTSLFILSLGSELFHIRSYCGCLVGKATAKVSPLGMVVTTGEEEEGITTIETEGGRIYLAREFTPAPEFIIEETQICSYVWLPVLTGMSAVGLHVARHFTGDFLTVEPLVPYLDHAVAALFLLTIIVRCAHVRKVQPNFCNGLAIIFGLLAIISQTGLLQLPITPISYLEPYIDYIMFGLRCLLPLSTCLYCVLQTVVSFKTKISLGSNKIIRAQRVFVSIFISLTALYIITTHALPYFHELFDFSTIFLIYLATYYQYIYWGFEGLTIFFIMGFVNEFCRIAMCCGCFRCSCCKKRGTRKIEPLHVKSPGKLDLSELSAIEDDV